MKRKVVSRLALASSAAVLFTAACTSIDSPTSKIAAPDGVVADFGVATAGRVTVCMDPTSSPGSYTFTPSDQANLSGGDYMAVLPEIVDANPGTNCVDMFIRATNPVNLSYASMTVTASTGQTGEFTFTCFDDDLSPGDPLCNSGVAGVNGASVEANSVHGVTLTYLFIADEPPPPPDTYFLILDEDAIDNGSMPNKFTTKNVNDDIAKLGQRLELRWFAANVGATIVLHSGGMGDEGWFAPKTIPTSWVNAGPTTDGLRNFIGLPVGPGLGTGSNPESRLDKIPNVTPLRAEGLYGLIGKTVCAVVYDSDISINYGPLNGSLKGATLGIVAFTVDNVQRLTGYSSSSLPKVTITVVDADEACGTEQVLYLDAPVISDSGKPVDVIPNGAG